MLEFNPWRDLVGVRYAMPPDPPRTFDCYSLVVWVREICYLTKTPLIVDAAFISYDNLSGLLELHQERELYTAVPNPEPGDIMIFNQNHIGVVVEGGVLSAVKELGVVYYDWRKMKRFFSTAYPVRYSQ